jgi:hypothetical protein
MQSYREILDGGGLDDGRDETELIEAKVEYTWDNINTALTMLNMSPKQIARVLSAIKKVVKERLTVDALNEVTTAGVGVGDYTPPLGMSRRDSEKFSTRTAMLKQFDQCTLHMGRKGMLQHCRKMGLSLGHLKDDDIRKTLNGMSVRNKRKFMSVADGTGGGSTYGAGMTV